MKSLRARLVGAVLATGIGVATAVLPIRASAIPLHGYCRGAGQCVDNNTNSPTSNNPPTDFGFTISSGLTTGTFSIDILIPNNENAGIVNFPITGDLTGTATLFSATAWTGAGGQKLDSYLGISASPANPIGAYLPSTQALDPGTTGFFVYDVSFPSVTLQSPSNPNVSPLLNTTSLPLGSYIVGFLTVSSVIEHGPKKGQTVRTTFATANSGAIFETGEPVPEPATLLLLSTGILAVGARALGRRQR